MIESIVETLLERYLVDLAADEIIIIDDLFEPVAIRSHAALLKVLHQGIHITQDIITVIAGSCLQGRRRNQIRMGIEERGPGHPLRRLRGDSIF